MKNNPLPRLDTSPETRRKLLPYCRLKPGQIWIDSRRGHRVGCLDSCNYEAVEEIMNGQHAQLAIHDPPYNLAAFEFRSVPDFILWCKTWVSNTCKFLAQNSSLYVWMGADQNNGFQPFPDFIIMMRDQPFRARSHITMRNQRGYGTQKNWMAIRQELLYYTMGNPDFNIDAEYTDIPKILRGYYKEVNGKKMENIQRGRSDTIRAGNVWIDIQQIFYRMEENVSGCYAQKPMKSIERILRASSNLDDLVIDFFAHSGTTLLACEILNRKCVTIDIDPVYAEISIRRLERFRATGRTGWQNGHPFEEDLAGAGIVVNPSTESSVQETLF